MSDYRVEWCVPEQQTQAAVCQGYPPPRQLLTERKEDAPYWS